MTVHAHDAGRARIEDSARVVYPMEGERMQLDEAFWQKHCHLGGRQLHRKYPGRYYDPAGWRKAKRKAVERYPWLFHEEPEQHQARIVDNMHHCMYHKPAVEMMLALFGDTHGSSKEERLDELHTFYDICEAEGVTHALHAGDITAGDRVYPGQLYEVKRVGAHAQVDDVVVNYPYRKGIETLFVTGNHDLSHWKHSGVDIGRLIESERDDMTYLGRYGATVELSPGFTVYVLHMDGGVPYAISYRRQKIVEGFMGGTKPSVFMAGHDHQHCWFDMRNIEVFGTGCFEGQTDFLRRKGIEPQIGGWVVNVKLDEDGGIRRTKAEWVKFYE